MPPQFRTCAWPTPSSSSPSRRSTSPTSPPATASPSTGTASSVLSVSCHSFHGFLLLTWSPSVLCNEDGSLLEEHWVTVHYVACEVWSPFLSLIKSCQGISEEGRKSNSLTNPILLCSFNFLPSICYCATLH